MIQSIRNGNGTAADELVRRHLARVRNLVFQLVLNHDAADDVTQDVFARALRGLPTFRGQSLFVTWLHRIAVNVSYAHLRQSGRRRADPLPEESMDVASTSPESAVIVAEEKDRVALALEQLPPQLRTAIVLTVMQGMSAIDAAEIEECPVGTMYWRIHEARRRLRHELKDWME
ncbi:MAG: sigma-70 family RNA polymerase sigma factor [Planctomycetes bacterium]|nr:sigma-70 family RNA polymerase sigma factor [Planctomycetota bacterium]